MGLPAADVLTPRQMEILQLIADGYATKQAADHLRISIKTYETHRGALQRRLGISTIAGLTRYAIRQGLIEP
jgi:DNA-binding CsgD family transcriptional regulator